MNFIRLIYVKMPTIVSMINTTYVSFKRRKIVIVHQFDIYEQLKFLTQLSCAEKRLITSEPRSRYEGCSNMNASGFITFFTYMLRQNGKRFFKGLYVTFKLAPDLKTNTVYLSSYSPWKRGHVSILTNLMFWTYTSDRRAYIFSIHRWNFLKVWRKYPHILIKWFCEGCENQTCFCKI